MRSIALVNTMLPTAGNKIRYYSGDSLRDYDIVLFDPKFPYESRVQFDAGGSCLSIEGTQRIQSAMNHWRAELIEALKIGKTVFIILSEKEVDMGANSSSFDKKQRTYHTFHINNYDALPIKVEVRNTKGKHIIVVDNNYKGLHDALKEIAHYEVILEPEIGKKIYTAKDGTSIASILEPEKLPGKIVLLPHFNFDQYQAEDSNKWSKEALEKSRTISNQLIAIDTFFRNETAQTPPPAWLGNIKTPKEIADIDKEIKNINTEIEKMNSNREARLKSRESLLEYSHLLYEKGKGLELAIERSLRLLGYKVENYREGELEIDHIITSKEGKRLIGESEGKDNSAIDISKFRQLESNINEDFQRDNVETPAKGVLFGNGFRLTSPDERDDQFTTKCITNAKRLGTALIRTTDLYKAILYAIDHPNDEAFKISCRRAIEDTIGQIVEFPEPGKVLDSRNK